MKTEQRLPIVILLFIFSFFLRLSLISNGPYSVDSLSLALAAQKTLETGQLHYHFGSGYPLIIALGAAFLWLSHSDPVLVLNLISVVLSALCVPLLYLITRRWLDSTCALLTSLLFCVCPIFLGVSVYGTSHTPAVFFQLLGLWAFQKWEDTGRRHHFILSGVCVGLVAAARLQEFTLISVPLFALMFFFRIKNEWPQDLSSHLKNAAGFFILAGLTGAAFYLPYLMGPMRAAYLTQFASFQSVTVAHGLYQDSLVAMFQFLTAILSALGFLVSALGFLFLLRDKPKLFWVGITWIGVPLFFYAHLYTFIPRFLTALMPPLCLAQGYCLALFIRKNGYMRAAALIVFAFLFSSTFMMIYPIVHERHERAFLPEYVKWVETHTAQDARIIVIDDGLFYEQYTDLGLLGRPHGYFTIEQDKLLEFKNTVDGLLALGIPVYITYVGLYDYDPENIFSNFLKKNYRLDVVGESLYEDWHRGEIFRRVFYNPLVRISK